MRKKLIKQRLAMEAQAALKLSEWVERHFLGSLCYQRARRIGLYAAFNQEVDTRLVFDSGLSENKVMCFPRVVGAGEMVFLREDRWSEMTPNQWGILEPALGREEIPAHGLDLVVVPGVAFSKDGFRIGYGGGFYDRLLKTLGPETLSVGFAYAFQVLDDLPHDEHDQHVKRLVTERGFVKICP